MLNFQDFPESAGYRRFDAYLDSDSPAVIRGDRHSARECSEAIIVGGMLVVGSAVIVVRGGDAFSDG
jgi:hypothetical protein